MIFKDITFDLKYPNDDKPKISNNKTADKKDHTFTFLSAVFTHVLETKITEVLGKLSMEPSEELELEFQNLLEEKRKINKNE